MSKSPKLGHYPRLKLLDELPWSRYKLCGSPAEQGWRVNQGCSLTPRTRSPTLSCVVSSRERKEFMRRTGLLSLVSSLFLIVTPSLFAQAPAGGYVAPSFDKQEFGKVRAID